MKTKRIKAVPYWIDPYELKCRNGGLLTTNKMFDDVPVFILPANAASYERMVEQMAKAPYHDYTWTVLSDREKGEYRHAVRVQLRAIGITKPKKTKGRK